MKRPTGAAARQKGPTKALTKVFWLGKSERQCDFSGCLCPPPQLSGTVSGVVTQAGAEGMPDATVVLSNPTLGTAVALITTDDGVFADAEVAFPDGINARRWQFGFPCGVLAARPNGTRGFGTSGLIDGNLE